LPDFVEIKAETRTVMERSSAETLAVVERVLRRKRDSDGACLSLASRLAKLETRFITVAFLPLAWIRVVFDVLEGFEKFSAPGVVFGG
jgi:hypothetical protein